MTTTSHPQPVPAAALAQVGIAVDHVSDDPTTAAATAALHQADRILTTAEHTTNSAWPLRQLRQLLDEAERCHRAGEASSPELEARFRAATLALVVAPVDL